MTDEVNVISRTQQILVEPTTGAVSVINAGPPGPPGGSGGDSLWEETSGDLHPINLGVTLTLFPEENLLLLSGASIGIYATDNVGISSNNNVNLTPGTNGDATIGIGVGTGVTIIQSGTVIVIPNLPTSDPAITGALYVDGSGFLKVSP